MPTGPTVEATHCRLKVFVDFWNFQLSVNSLAKRFPIDWKQMGRAVANESSSIVDPGAAFTYQDMNVYGSYDPSSVKDISLHRWAVNILDKFPGVQVTMIPRQRKRSGPVCPSCYDAISKCPSCQADMRGTEEKGVDTRIATDMIKLAWVENYDVAVLLSSDRDFVPVVEFLDTRGIKTIHGAFPPKGAELTKACWGHISIPKIMNLLERK